MKHVLLITFYFPPYTGIEGNRMFSWAKSLHQAGFRVTVLTRQWKSGGQSNWADYVSEYHEADELVETIDETYRIIRLPYKWRKGFKKFRSMRLGSLYYWWGKLFGILHPETDAYAAFHDYADKFLRTEKVDFIIVSSPPLNIIRLGHVLKKKYNTMFIADFRDSFNNKLMQVPPKLSIKEKAEVVFFRKYIRKWLGNADGIVSVSQPVLDTIRRHFSYPSLIVSNGFEKDLFREIPFRPNGQEFIMSMVGSLYPHQEISFMCRGINLFLEKVKPADVKIRFVGIKGRTEVVNEIKKYIDRRHLFFTERIDRMKALEIMRNSHILLQVGWKGYKGFCPGKVFEYLAAGRNILVAPSDGDMTDRVINETRAGISASSVEEVAEYLESKYNEWKKTGSLQYDGDPNAIAVYTREKQNAILTAFLTDMINK
jgi:hypothetical protein